MLQENLEINLITYNRAKSLERTLTQLRQSPFAECKITILDNASDDETPEICARHRELFPNLHILTHRKNMGLSANYLRAVEISTSLYTWVLCDDDTYDWSDCSDVIAEIEKGEIDLICMGAPGQQDWERGLRTSTRQLWKRGANFFFVHTFVPSLIFKTDLFDAECLTLGYKNAVNSYPHLRFVTKALERDFSEYVAKRMIVHREAEEGSFGGLHWLSVAFASSGTIPDARMRRASIYESAASRSRKQWLKSIAEQIILAKLSAPQKVPRQYLQMVLACSGEQRRRILVLSPLVMLPSAAYRLVRRLRRLIKGRSEGYTDDETRTMGAASVDHFRT